MLRELFIYVSLLYSPYFFQQLIDLRTFKNFLQLITFVKNNSFKQRENSTFIKILTDRQYDVKSFFKKWKNKYSYKTQVVFIPFKNVIVKKYGQTALSSFTSMKPSTRKKIPCPRPSLRTCGLILFTWSICDWKRPRLMSNTTVDANEINRHLRRNSPTDRYDRRMCKAFSPEPTTAKNPKQERKTVQTRLRARNTFSCACVCSTSDRFILTCTQWRN